jgi:hypothetical protein
LLWSSDINVKKPNSSGFYAAHQDATYAGLFPSSSVLTVWVALSHPVGEREGCLAFYHESHKLHQLPHKSEMNENNMLVLGQYIDADVIKQLNNPVSIELRAGQATLHSFDCVHSSSPNNSDQPSVGWALRYMAGYVIQTKPIREMATWICGSNDANSIHFDLEPILPECLSIDDIKRGRDAQKESLLREESNYFANDVSSKVTTKSALDIGIKH